MIFALEIIGTIAFAVSGALVAIRKKMDIFGVVILGMTTAIGGGIIRDLILDFTPPSAFQNPVYALVAIGVSCLVFYRPVRKHVHETGRLLLWMDSLGLGVFTVIGVQTALSFHNLFLSIFVGVLTGVGGGVLRDLFAGENPAIFVRHFYATASLCGAIVTAVLLELLGVTSETASNLHDLNTAIALIAGFAVVMVLRLLAARFRWNLPVPKEIE